MFWSPNRKLNLTLVHASFVSSQETRRVWRLLSYLDPHGGWERGRGWGGAGWSSASGCCPGSWTGPWEMVEMKYLI